MQYLFQLWREFKLSIAEIISVFPSGKIDFFDKKNLILNLEEDENILEKVSNLWWTIKLWIIIEQSILEIWQKSKSKFNYGISLYGQTWLKNLLLKTKKEFKNNWISSRFINNNFENLSSAQIIWEDLIESGADFTIIKNIKKDYLAKTIWIQDIEEYSKRDYGKSRDMQIGMLPPKLAQIMINLSWIKDNIYDPFVWLWTVLIEWAYMWYKNLYWSDFNSEMIEVSKKNLWNIKSKFTDINYNIFLYDARDMGENKVSFKNINSIITEWFLWEIMTKKNICLERINIQKKNLSKLYIKFFEGLKKLKYTWNIIISFPFWEIDKKYIYFDNIYQILDEYCNIEKILPNNLEIKETKSGSLLYKRDNQLVWREIFKLTIK
jgi:tRNA G10  N-methylase Trm11